MTYSNIQLRIFYFLQYQITARYWKGHGIHSPFVFEFAQNVLFTKRKFTEYNQLENARNGLLKNQQVLMVKEIGAGSTNLKNTGRSISKLASVSSVDKKYGQLLFRIAHHYKPAKMVEFGTSIGMSSHYLSVGNPLGKFITIEGNATLYNFAKNLLELNGFENCECIHGLFDDVLKNDFKRLENANLVYIDGNHSFDPTIRYFRFFINTMTSGIIVLDDIHWSKGMHDAWKTIVTECKEFITIDLFRMGLVIKGSQLTPGHYVIRF